ncbi:AmmeMemoRadiSam system protein B [Acidobacteriota bacterium]
MKDIVPKLRVDLEVIPTAYQGQNAYVVKDTLGLIKKPVLLYGDILELVSLIDGRRNVQDIQLELIRLREGMLVSSDEISQILAELDCLFLLDSDQYQKERDRIISAFVNLKVRSATLAGQAYPDSLDDLKGFLESLIQQGDNTINLPDGKRIIALVAPHIDLAVGKGVYSKTYGSIKELSFKNIILLGTGHSITDHLISLTEKDYETPLGRVRTDREKVLALRQLDLPIIAPDDFAHRSEHSIEFQLIFLQHLLGSDFCFLPILCGVFPGSMDSYAHPGEIPDVKEFIHNLKLIVNEDPAETLVVAGVDFSHIGPKFGHTQQASALLSETKNYDRVLIDSICRGDVQRFWTEIKQVGNRFNVCGFSALACLMELFPGSKGECLDYEIWNEEPTQSAVSFAGIALFE